MSLVDMTWKFFVSAPMDGTEILVAYPKQPKTYELVYFDKIHLTWRCKGELRSGLVEQGCVWTALPRWPKEYV